MKLKIYAILFPILALILLYVIFNMIHYLAINKYIVECFANNTSHTVNLPLNDVTSCRNFCGPTARCAITGQQCFTDIDCPGCQPKTKKSNKNLDCVPAANDA